MRSRSCRVIQFEYGLFNIASHDLLHDFYQHLRPRGFLVGKISPRRVAFLDYHFNMENFHGANFLAVRSDQTELIEQLAGRATRERLTPGDIDEEAGPASRPAQVFRDAAALHVLRWSMDRVALQRRFAAAEHRTVMGERRIERQRAIIERVRELGQDVGEAAELLVEFERQQTLALDELEKCRALLAAAT